MKVNVILNFTTSKLLAYLVLIIGSVFAFVFQDGNVLLGSFAAASAVIATKTYTSSRTLQKEMEYRKKEEDIG